MSAGLAGVYQSHLLGVYSIDEEKTEQNNRAVLRQLDGPNFLYYWDWGPNSGANWMVSDKFWETNRGIESYNLETFPQQSICPEDLHLVGPMKVWNSADRAWQTDWTLRLESFNEEVDCCDKVRSGGRSCGVRECFRLESSPPRLCSTFSQNLWTLTPSTQATSPHVRGLSLI